MRRSDLYSNGDAIDIAVHNGRIVGVRCRPDDRVNHEVADAHGDEPDVTLTCQRLAAECTAAGVRLARFARR